MGSLALSRRLRTALMVTAFAVVWSLFLLTAPTRQAAPPAAPAVGTITQRAIDFGDLIPELSHAVIPGIIGPVGEPLGLGVLAGFGPGALGVDGLDGASSNLGSSPAAAIPGSVLGPGFMGGTGMTGSPAPHSPGNAGQSVSSPARASGFLEATSAAEAEGEPLDGETGDDRSGRDGGDADGASRGSGAGSPGGSADRSGADGSDGDEGDDPDEDDDKDDDD